LRAQLSHHHFDASLLDCTQAARGNAQADETTLALNPEALHVQIGEEATATPVIRVGDAIAAHRAFAGDLTDSGHDDFLQPDPTALTGERAQK
jgi:hypothetical protein